VGQPPEAVEQARSSGMWPGLEAMAPTLAYDAIIVGDAALPTGPAGHVRTPALVIESEASPQWLRSATRALAAQLPNAQHAALPGQFHQPDPAALAVELAKFFQD
jgi:hypothetical protein